MLLQEASDVLFEFEHEDGTGCDTQIGKVVVVGDVEVRNLSAALTLGVEFCVRSRTVKAKNEGTASSDGFFEKKTK